ncbi:MAG: U32 family peptidase [Clostridia bacterium]|nr:U32 family peptidase [Clostridia bacterium]
MTTDILRRPILKKPEGSGAHSVPELLSPAGDPECARAAINAGADAVYLGLKEGSARAAAGNFTFDELRDVCEYAHLRGAKVYVAVNTLPFGGEEAMRFAANAQKAASEGADGVIVQDAGLLALLAEMRDLGQFPPFFRIHASTQAAIANIAGIKTAKALGIDRVILPRELDLEEIAALRAASDIELEIFVHGAMCMCFSGNCLLSSFIGGRSGNRGSCAQPCRMKYSVGSTSGAVNGKTSDYPLSPDDLCALPFLDRVCASGVSSIKIEGRLKSPDYTALTTRIYREALDSISEGRFGEFCGSELGDALRCLRILFTRSGGGPGFLLGNTGRKHLTESGPGRTGAFIGETDFIRTAPAPSGSPENLKFFTFKIKRADGGTGPELSPGDGVTIIDERGYAAAGGTVNRTGSNVGTGSTAEILVCGNIERGYAGAAAHFRVFQTADAALNKAIRELTLNESGNVRIPVEFDFKAAPGEQAYLNAYVPGCGVCVSVNSGAPVSEAVSMPVDAGNITRLLSKLSGTLYYASAIRTDIRGNIFMPVSAVNSLRRKAADELTAALKKSFAAKRSFPAVPSSIPKPSAISLRGFSRKEPKARIMKMLAGGNKQLKSRYFFDARDYISNSTYDDSECALVYVPFDTWKKEALLKEVFDKARKEGCMVIASLPLLPFHRDRPEFKEELAFVIKSADGLQFTNLGDFSLTELIPDQAADELIICADHSLNTSYPYALCTLAGMGADIITLSPEYPDVSLAGNAPEGVLTEIACGPVALMRMRHCVIGHGEKNCRRCEEVDHLFRLTDTSGEKYDILTLPDTVNSLAGPAAGSGAVNYGRRYCENVILSTKEFTPFAYNAHGAEEPAEADKIAHGNCASERIILRTQIGPGKYRS